MKLLPLIIFASFLFVGGLPAMDKSPGGDQQICKADVFTAVDLQAEQSNFVSYQPCNYDKQLEFIVQNESPGENSNEVINEQNDLQIKPSITLNEDDLNKNETANYELKIFALPERSRKPVLYPLKN